MTDNATIRTYRRTPITVRAVQVTHSNYEQVADWCGGAIGLGHAGQPTVCIYNPHINRVAQIGDYVVEGTDGHYYVRKAHIFETTYEPTGETP